MYGLKVQGHGSHVLSWTCWGEGYGIGNESGGRVLDWGLRVVMRFLWFDPDAQLGLINVDPALMNPLPLKGITIGILV